MVNGNQVRPVAQAVAQEFNVPLAQATVQQPTAIETEAEKERRRQQLIKALRKTVKKRTKNKKGKRKFKLLLAGFKRASKRAARKIGKDIGRRTKRTLLSTPKFRRIRTPSAQQILTGGTPKGKVNPLKPDVAGLIFPQPLPDIKEKKLQGEPPKNIIGFVDNVSTTKKNGKRGILNQESIFFK